MAERMTCNHLISVRVRMMAFNGRYANWLKQAVCKTVTLETLLVRIQPYRFFIYFLYQWRCPFVFEYCGCTISFMKVCQIYDGKKITYEYRYDTDLFKKYIIQFLSQHIYAWDSEYAFNCEDIVIAFFNEVIEEGSVEETKEKIEIL